MAGDSFTEFYLSLTRFSKSLNGLFGHSYSGTDVLPRGVKE